MRLFTCLSSLLILTVFSLSAQTAGCISGNCENGTGTYVYRNGAKYSGDWKEGKKHGKGRMQYTNGAVYDGDWDENRKHGTATYSWNEGNSYTGDFQFDQMTGQGKKIYRNGDQYVGEFYNGNRHGKGTYYWKAGAKYEGGWVNDQRTGEGRYTSETGDIMEGRWQNGQLAEARTIADPAIQEVARVDSEEETPEKAPKKQKEEVAEAKKATVINWNNPASLATEITDSKTDLSLCIETEGKVKDVEFYVNEELKAGGASRGVTIAETDACNKQVTRTLSLKPGQNVIKVVVKTNNGETIESERVITANYRSAPVIIDEKRTALIIGNGAYESGPLRNPANDASAMAERLEGLGFEVMLYTNADQNEMKKAIRDFGEKIEKEGGVGLFYFAGHGMQVDGSNYLIPVEAEINREIDVELESVGLNRVLAEMEYAQNRMNIVILDACRNNPYNSQFRSATGEGLTITNAPSGTFIAFATAPGSVAVDGEGENGLYTQELLNALETPGLKIEDVFKQVRTNVRTKSDGLQIPWENSSIEGDFYFRG